MGLGEVLLNSWWEMLDHTLLFHFFSCYGSYLLLVSAASIIWVWRESPGNAILVILLWQKILRPSGESHSFLKPRFGLSLFLLSLVRQVNCTDVCNWIDRLKLNSMWLLILTVYLSNSLIFLAQARHLSVNAFKTSYKRCSQTMYKPQCFKMT